MDRVSAVMLRAGFVWLLLGAVVGAGMMIDDVLPGSWRVWMGPTHGHMLFVGWFVQFAIGVAYWLFPRRRSPARPVGYHQPLALAAVAMLNAGLLLRVVAEPAQRSGHRGDWTTVLLGCSGALQVAAFAVFVTQLWPRAAARGARKTPPGGAGSRHETSP
ncbi:MAG TPA: hypothetical protein VKB09_05765 [Thermomicrobiales bacterium]|nr:hypothetical protein [Thermomicrobiales bacterium]